MKSIAAGLLALGVLLVAPAVQAQSQFSPGFAAGDAGLTPSQRAGREIWFFATAGNDRFHAYVFPQRLGPRSTGTPSSMPRIATGGSTPGG
jgi:hypothetical protein